MELYLVICVILAAICGSHGNVSDDIHDRIEDVDNQIWIEEHKGLLAGIIIGSVLFVIILCVTCCCCCGCCCCRRDRTVIVNGGAPQGPSIVVAQQTSHTVNPMHAGYDQ